MDGTRATTRWWVRAGLAWAILVVAVRGGGFVKFLVLGVDGLAFGSADDLPEAHWTYMDSWADALIARGPTMSVDGHHTGSVHVVELPTSAAAHRFAHEEPFAMAGWYSTISVSPVVPSMDGSMWDRPAAVPGQASCLVTASFLDQNRSAVDLASSVRQRLDALESARWIFVGVTSDDTGNAVGFVAMADEDPSDTQRNALALFRSVGITDPTIRSQLWRRGGRPA